MIVLNLIYTFFTLFKNVIFRKKNYKLHFVADTTIPTLKRWFYDFPHWGFAHDYLEMVAGADQLCELYANGKNELNINIIATNKQLQNDEKKLYDEFVAETLPNDIPWDAKYIYGRTYKCQDIEMWICPVTLFVLGRYPKYLYIKRGNINI